MFLKSGEETATVDAMHRLWQGNWPANRSPQLDGIWLDRKTAYQNVRLKAGQILRLGRGPNDPVDLVVNNRIFARGELIEVDGEIGVRLVQLAK